MSSTASVISQSDAAANPADDAVASLRKQYWQVLIFAVVVLWLVFADFIHLCRIRTDGHFNQTTDDAYITMALAKNLLQHGVWGIQPDQFASLASSPGWVLLMAGVFQFVMPSEYVPLGMNVFFATLLFVIAWAIFRSLGVRPIVTLFGLFAILVLTPIVPVALTGLEHISQCCADLAYVFAVASLLADDAPTSSKRPAVAAILLLSPFLTLIRYEGVFLIATAGALLLARKFYKTAVLTGLLGAIPIVVSGIIFLQKGWFFFPSTLIQKGNMPLSAGPMEYVGKLVSSLVANLHLSFASHSDGAHLAVLIGMVFLAFIFRGLGLLSSRLGLMSVLFISAALMHLALARLGWFFRYEAYLMCIGLVIVISLMDHLPWERLMRPDLRPNWLTGLVLAGSIFFAAEPLIDRGITAYAITPIASRNIWEQHYQMGRFVRAYYQGSSIAANDIGAINFFGNFHCLDLMGLGSAKIMRLMKDGKYNTDAIRAVAREEGVKIAIVYEAWYYPYGGLPPEWNRVGRWTISDNIVCGGNAVTFFAVDPAEARNLESHLRDFQSQLPDCVDVALARYDAH